MSFPNNFHPTRRDLILIVLTLTSSYLLTSILSESPANLQAFPPSRNYYPAAPAGSGSSGKNYIPSWLWPPASHHESIREESFGESVRTYGSSAITPSSVLSKTGLEEWDQGSEEMAVSSGMGVGNTAGLEGMKTKLLGHAPGWTLMDRVYIFNGSFYVVTYVFLFFLRFG